MKSFFKRIIHDKVKLLLLIVIVASYPSFFCYICICFDNNMHGTLEVEG